MDGNIYLYCIFIFYVLFLFSPPDAPKQSFYDPLSHPAGALTLCN